MGIKVIKDFQQGDTVVVRLEFEGAINLTGNTFKIVMSNNKGGDPEYDQTFVANTNGYPDDNITQGIINLIVNTSNLTGGIYSYSITRIASGQVTTIARTGLNSVDTVECKKQL